MTEIAAEVEEESLVAIRTFKTPGEIWDLPSFKHDNPVTKSNYYRLLGDYTFNDEVRCCFMEEGRSLCRQGHKFGYVVILNDKSISIIGNCCGRDKFDFDHKLRIDTNRYANRKKLLTARSRLAKLRDEKKQRLNEIEGMRTCLREMRKRLAEFGRAIGSATFAAIESRAKSGSLAVSVTGVTYREFVDDEGNAQKERSTVPINVGYLNGVQCFSKELYSDIAAKMKRVEDAFNQLEFEQDRDLRESQLNRFSSEIELSSEILLAGQRMLDHENTFFQSDLSGICFLSSNMRDRIDTAVELSRQLGHTLTRNKAKSQLVDLEEELKRKNSVEKLEVN